MRQTIGTAKNEIFFSLASVWEVAIKHISNPRSMPVSDEDFIRYCFELGYNLFPIKAEHIALLKTLQRHVDAPMHKDPFDRLLICQAKFENMKFMTHDRLLPDYDEPCIMLV